MKASAKNNQFPTQVICVYITNPNDLKEIVTVYDILEKNGLLQIHLKQEINENSINYITDADTRKAKQDEKVAVTYTSDDIAKLHALHKQKEKISASDFARMWQVLELDLKIRVAIKEPPNKTNTCFSEDESLKRFSLIEKIDVYQSKNQTPKIEPLDELIKDIRQLLTGNYRFSTVDLLSNSIRLLEIYRPKQNMILSIFSPNPTLEGYNNIIKFFNELIVQEEKRLHPQGPK